MAPAEYGPGSSDHPETIPGNDVDSVFGVRLRCWVRDGLAVRRKQGGAPVIEVQHLTKQYGRFTAVDDVTFRVDKGEILGFLGPNGAGKTTTMRILTGYMPATAGM